MFSRDLFRNKLIKPIQTGDPDLDLLVHTCCYDALLVVLLLSWPSTHQPLVAVVHSPHFPADEDGKRSPGGSFLSVGVRSRLLCRTCYCSRMSAVLWRNSALTQVWCSWWRWCWGGMHTRTHTQSQLTLTTNLNNGCWIWNVHNRQSSVVAFHYAGCSIRMAEITQQL